MSDQPKSDRPKKYEVIKQGLEELRNPEKANIDIIAVPGLGANPEKSWTHPDTDFNWLKNSDGLARDFPSARILLYQYGSAWQGDIKVKNFLDNIAVGLLYALISKREGCTRRPIVFIGHSMGGLVIAKAVCLAESQYDKWPMVFEATSGCIFFGTPFDGAPVASVAAMYASVAKSVGQSESSALLKIMEPGSEYLRELKKEFLRLAVKLNEKIQLFCFWELDPTNFAKMVGMDWGIVSVAFQVTIPKSYQMFVNKDSSILVGHEECGLHSAHRNLVQFKTFRDERYQLVRAPLKRIIHGASLVAKGRFSSTRNIDRDMVKNILDALEGVHVHRKHETLKAKAVPQSWVLDEPEYASWLQADVSEKQAHDERCLWIRGPVGKGKTSAVLAAIDQIDKISAEADSSDSLPVLYAFFFCDKSPECSSAEELLKSVIRQLIRQQETLASYAKQFAKKKGKGQDTTSKSQFNSQAGLSVENLWQSLQGMFADSSVGTIYIVANNLHELPENATSTQTFLALLCERLVSKNGHEGQSQIRWLVTSRARQNLQKALPNENIRLIDLDDDKHNMKIQSEVQRHAQKKIEELRTEKKYNMALSYFASSLVGKRAETTKWVDVTCVHLAALPSPANDLQVRRLLEEVPQDVKDLLDRAWLSLLDEKNEDTGKIKELLRALVLTYEDPTEKELAILAGFSSSTERRDELQRLIELCSPLLMRDVSEDGETMVSFVNEDVKEHLMTFSESLLGLSEEGKQWQQGMIALRCFTHVLDGLVVVEPSELNEPIDDSEGSATSEDSDDFGWLDAEGDSISENEEDEDEDGEREERNDENASVKADQTEEELTSTQLDILNYPVKHWLRHASKATSDIARILSEHEEFWRPDSRSRFLWLQKYSEDNDSFDDVEIKGWKALHVAAAVGYVQLVASLIDNGHQNEINEHNSEDFTPLHMAAIFGRVNIVEELLNRGAEINDGDGGAGTPLVLAASTGNISVMEKLLQREEVDPCASERDWPILNSAIESGKFEAVRLLLDRGAPLVSEQATDEDGDEVLCPLAFSAFFSDVAIFKQLLDAGQDKHTAKQYGQAFVVAAATGRLDALEKLLEFDISPESLEDALKQAVDEKSWDAVPVILKNSVGLKCDEVFKIAVAETDKLPKILEAIRDHTQGTIPQDLVDECLYQATDNEKQSTVEILLNEFHADPNATGKEYGNALTASANDGTDEILKMLLDKGADINSENGWALQAAAAQGHKATVELLLERGADVDAHTNSEQFPEGTALQAACEAGQLDIVQLLLDKGADPNLGGGVFGYPIIAATSKGETKILERLLKDQRLELNILGGDDDSTPLINAAFTCPVESLQQMVAKGADVNLPDLDGDTALIAAAQRGDIELLGFLLENGADILHVSKRNQTALEAALEHGKMKCVSYLAVRASSILRALQLSVSSQHPQEQDVAHDIVCCGTKIYSNRDFMSLHPSRPEDNIAYSERVNKGVTGPLFRYRKSQDKAGEGQSFDEEATQHVESGQQPQVDTSYAASSSSCRLSTDSQDQMDALGPGMAAMSLADGSQAEESNSGGEGSDGSE